VPVRVVTGRAGHGGGGGGAVAGSPVYIQKTQPSGLTEPALWLPLNNDLTPKELEEARIFTPEFTPGVPLSALFGWYSAPTIGQWNDLSGNARHLTQATPAMYPILKENVQNGQSVLRFTEADLTSLKKVSLSQAQPFEIISVFRVRTDVNLLKTNIVSRGSGGFRWNSDSTGGSRTLEYEFGSTRSTASTVAPLTWNLYRLIVNGASSYVRLGSAGTVLGGPSNPGAGTLGEIALGSVSGMATDIDWGELIVTNRLLTDPEAASVAAYAADTWGTA
jgi:hypothetical protein